MFAQRFLGVLAAAAMAAASHAQVKVSANLTEGQSISGDVIIKVTATAKNLVNSVEFYVNDELRGTDDSQPYEFRLDAIAESEGPIKIKVQAFTDQGESGTLNLNLKIDNGVDKGPDAHVELGKEALNKGDYKTAIKEGRIALKAKAGYLPAKLMLAQANFIGGVYDSAQKFVEDVLAEEPNNMAALDLQSAIALRQVFSNPSGDRDAVVEATKKALILAASSRSKIYAHDLDAIGKVDDKNLKSWADLGIRAGRYSMVISELKDRFSDDPRKTSIANRYIYALMRANRQTQLASALNMYFKLGKPDAIGYALRAVYYQRMGAENESLADEKQMLLLDSTDLTVRSVEAYLAMARNKASVLGKAVADLMTDNDSRYEVIFYETVVSSSANDFEGARKNFQKGVLAEPTGYDLYLLRANQLIAFGTGGTVTGEDKAFQLKEARSYVEAALAARPESFEALTLMAILNLMDGKVTDAISMGEAAQRNAPEYAAAPYVLSTAYSAQSQAYQNAAADARRKAAEARNNGMTEEAGKLNEQASKYDSSSRELIRLIDAARASFQKLDKPALDGRGVPTAMEAWRYFAVRGRTPLLIQPQY